MNRTWHYNEAEIVAAAAAIPPREVHLLVSLVQLCTKDIRVGQNDSGIWISKIVSLITGCKRTSASISFLEWPPRLMVLRMSENSSSFVIRERPLGVKSILRLALSPGARSIQPASIKARMSLAMSSFVGFMWWMLKPSRSARDNKKVAR